MEEKGQMLCELWLAERLVKYKNDVKTVLKLFKSPYEAYDCDFCGEEFAALSKGCTEALKDKRLDGANNLLDYCEQHNIARVRIGSPYYPPALADIPDPPYLLFCRGNVGLLRANALVSMVGTRTMTTAGKYSAFRMAYELAEAGMCVVSGMALGNDSMCHAGAIAAGGKTIAVLGSGVDVVYPAQHATLYRHLVNNGHLVVSEFLPGTRPYGHNFPIRNRIIAGMSFGTVVVEAAEKSGSLITADLAEGYGRLIFAMPGYAYTESSAGSNKLTQQGAVITTDSRTVINEYNYLSGKRAVRVRKSHISLDECDKAIEELKLETRTVDPSPKVIKLDPESFFDRDSSSSAFPFSVKQELSNEFAEGKKNGKTVKSEKTKKRSARKSANVSDRSDIPDATKVNESERNEASENTVLPSPERLCAACEELGITVDADIRTVCEIISRRDVVDVESLSREGCRTEVALQMLSVLSSAGLLCEDVGGKFKLCKITE